MKFWLRAVLDPVLVVLTLFTLANIWGVPFDRLAMWTGRALDGFHVGNVQISLVDMAAGIAAFIVTILATRLLQTVLHDHILPESGWDEGTQYSVLSVLSYVGFTLATVLGVAVIGVDMTTIGLIAGGLSIGIGLGLQSIVNNFISGIILLIERPVKVGDWVIVGNHEGFVKRVSIRATEIETWRRASVIVPNAELLNTSVTNWTHHDRMGRMEIKVRVPRGADVDLVQEILLDCARKHARVTAWPEPSALFMDFGENGLDFELRCFTADNLWVYFIASDIRFAINRRLREEGIEIPLPQRVVHMADDKPTLETPEDADTG
jgi:small-conductance mechanosensitive channel